MKDFLTSVFENYTEQMYEGDQPCGKGHQLTGGGYADRWECRYGVGETSGESVLVAHIIINCKISLFICADVLEIIDIRYSGKSDVWGYNSKGDFTLPYVSPNHIHPLESEKIERILSMEFPGCFWRLVQNRALEIYSNAKAK